MTDREIRIETDNLFNQLEAMQKQFEARHGAN